MRWFVLVVCLIGFVSGLDVELDCPRSVFVGEEFSCVVEVEDGEVDYDLKVEVDSLRASVLEILDGDKWVSSYYYLDEFVEDEEEVMLRFGGSGEFDFVVKLRDGSAREEFDCGSIRVLDNGNLDSEDGENVSQIAQIDTDGVISLNGVDEVVVDEELVWVSREWRVVELLPYGFCLVLILLVGVILFERI